MESHYAPPNQVYHQGPLVHPLRNNRCTPGVCWGISPSHRATSSQTSSYLKSWVVEIERHNDYNVILIPRCPVSSCNTWQRLPIAQKIFYPIPLVFFSFSWLRCPQIVLWQIIPKLTSSYAFCLTLFKNICYKYLNESNGTGSFQLVSAFHSYLGLSGGHGGAESKGQQRAEMPQWPTSLSEVHFPIMLSYYESTQGLSHWLRQSYHE